MTGPAFGELIITPLGASSKPPGTVVRLALVAQAFASRNPTLVATATRPMLSGAGAVFGNWEVRPVGGYCRRLGDGQEDSV